MSEDVVKFEDSEILSHLAKDVEPHEQRRALIRQANSALGMLSSIPMKCKGEECNFSEHCPLQEEGLCETGERCPIEADLLRDMFIGYCDELDINPDINKVQAGLVKDLCSVEIQAIRACKLLSYGDVLVTVIDAVNSRTGEAYYKKIVNEAAFWSERLLSQKIRILDTLTASPLIRAKYLGGGTKKTLQEMLAEARELANKLMEHDDIEDAEYDTDWRGDK